MTPATEREWPDIFPDLQSRSPGAPLRGGQMDDHHMSAEAEALRSFRGARPDATARGNLQPSRQAAALMESLGIVDKDALLYL